MNGENKVFITIEGIDGSGKTSVSKIIASQLGLSCYLSGCGENVICDRHLPTVYFWYGNDKNICIADMIYKMTKKPDITIILNVSAGTVIERIKQKRSKNEISDYVYQRLSESKKSRGFCA